MPSTTVLSYQWTCPGGSCDAGAVDPEWAAKVQQGNILVVNVRNGNDGGNYTCTVIEGDTQQVGIVIYSLSVPSEQEIFHYAFICSYSAVRSTCTHVVNIMHIKLR